MCLFLSFCSGESGGFFLSFSFKSDIEFRSAFSSSSSLRMGSKVSWSSTPGNVTLHPRIISVPDSLACPVRVIVSVESPCRTSDWAFPLNGTPDVLVISFR